MLFQEYCIAGPTRTFTSSHLAGRINTLIGFLKTSIAIPRIHNVGKNHLDFVLSDMLSLPLLLKLTEFHRSALKHIGNIAKHFFLILSCWKKIVYK